jgi:glycosidase
MVLWQDKKFKRRWASILVLALVIQVVSAFAWAPGAMANTTNVSLDKRITFTVPKNLLNVTTKGSWDSTWSQSYNLTDVDNDGTYTASISGLNANLTYNYQILINNYGMSEPYFSGKPNSSGVLQISYSPKFFVAGDFDTVTRELVQNGANYTYTSPVLKDAVYLYKFEARETGKSQFISFLDPTNILTDVTKTSSRIAVGNPIEADAWVEQPGAKVSWSIPGSFTGWDLNKAYKMTHLVGGDYFAHSVVLNKGTYRFLIIQDGNLNKKISNNGNDFVLNINEPTKVNFYVKGTNPASAQVRINLAGVAGIDRYVPTLADNRWPRLYGDVQKAFAEPVNSPTAAKQYFVDYNFDGSIFKLQRPIPAGIHAAKVAFGPSLVETYGTATNENVAVNVKDSESDVIFTINYNTNPRVLTYAVNSYDGDYDGIINSGKIEFDSRSLTYKNPFGAVADSTTDITFRISAEENDVQFAKLELISPDSLTTSFDMKKVTSVGDLDYFEVTLPKTSLRKVGIYGYRFILIDGSAKVEYGDDSQRGGTGIASTQASTPFDLTVYDKNYKTPAWLKDAIVYQIFPDRFFDGSTANNRAKQKDGVRSTPAQFFDKGKLSKETAAVSQVVGSWTDLPINSAARADGVSGNEFYGGDIVGIQRKLDYLKSLGVSAVYLNPVFWAASNGKYDVADFNHLDPMFGQPVYNKTGDPKSGLNYAATRKASDKIYSDFTRAARAKGIRIINEGVFNHVGDDSVYFDRYEKYPEIGAYEYWSKVWALVGKGVKQAQAEEQVRKSFTAKVNPLTGKKYSFPQDFEYTKWFQVSNSRVTDSTNSRAVYRYTGYNNRFDLPLFQAIEPQTSDTAGIRGLHEWNNVGYRNEVVGTSNSAKRNSGLQGTASQRWIWLGSRGWHFDNSTELSTETLSKFRSAVKATAGMRDANGEVIDEPVILGEEMGNATKSLLGNQFDSVMNYRFRTAVQNFMIKGDAVNFHNELESIREDYPRPAFEAMLNLVGTHDTIRSITKYDNPTWENETLQTAAGASDTALKLQALTAVFQLSYPGAPTIYYGDEVGLAGTKDADAKRTFPWERVTEVNGKFSGLGKYADLFNVYQKAAKIRNDYQVFSTGDIKLAHATGDVLAYARKGNRQAGFVAINRSNVSKTIEADVTGFIGNGVKLTDLLNESATTVSVSNGKFYVSVPAMSAMMMVSDDLLEEVPQVQLLSADAGNKAITLSWADIPDTLRYNIWKTDIEGESLELLTNTTTNTFTDEQVENGYRYYYTVTAVTEEGESAPAKLVSATPYSSVRSVSVDSKLPDIQLGVGNRSKEVQVAIEIPGMTDNLIYANKDVPNVSKRLFYYGPGVDRDAAASVKLRYKRDSVDGTKKIYGATFEPSEKGTNYFYARVSPDNGETYTTSEDGLLTVLQSTTDTEGPVRAVLATITVEPYRAHLKWSLANATANQISDIAGFEVWRKADGEILHKKLQVLPNEARDFMDYSVANNVRYDYIIATYDANYNRTNSLSRSVVPKISIRQDYVTVNDNTTTLSATVNVDKVRAQQAVGKLTSSDFKVTLDQNYKQVNTKVSSVVLDALTRARGVNAVYKLETPDSSVNMPVRAINLPSVRNALLVAKDAEVDITLRENVPSNLVLNDLEDRVEAKGGKIVAPVVDFNLEASSKGRTRVVEPKGESYITRTFTLSGTDINVKRATGVIYVPETKEYRHAPTKFSTLSDGRVSAEVKLNGNHVYTVVQNGTTFTDIPSSSANAANIEAVANKMILEGFSDGTFRASNKLTRSQFAAAVERAIGALPANNVNIISNPNTAKLSPNTQVTRQEAAVMVAKALGVYGKKSTLTAADVNKTLATYKDAKAVSEYAKPAVAFAISAGIMTPAAETSIAPQETLSKAEASGMLLKMLRALQMTD